MGTGVHSRESSLIHLDQAIHRLDCTALLNGNLVRDVDPGLVALTTLETPTLLNEIQLLHR